MTAKNDTQVGGTHYLKPIQPWDVINTYDLNYYAGNVVKYMMRYKEKNGKQDLEKASHYLNYMLTNYERIHKND